MFQDMIVLTKVKCIQTNIIRTVYYMPPGMHAYGYVSRYYYAFPYTYDETYTCNLKVPIVCCVINQHVQNLNVNTQHIKHTSTSK